MSGPTRDLLVGLAGELDTAGVGVYSTSSVVADPSTGIYFGKTPATPNRTITLATYFTDDELKIAASTYRVNVNLRGTPYDTLDAVDLSDAVFSVLHGLERRSYGSVALVQMYRVNSIELGTDDLDRSERSDNYELLLDMPVTVLRPW